MTTKLSQDPTKIAADQDKEIEKAEEKTNFKLVPVSVNDKADESDKNAADILADGVKDKPLIKTTIGNADDSNSDVTSTVNMVADHVVVLDK